MTSSESGSGSSQTIFTNFRKIVVLLNFELWFRGGHMVFRNVNKRNCRKSLDLQPYVIKTSSWRHQTIDLWPAHISRRNLGHVLAHQTVVRVHHFIWIQFLEISGQKLQDCQICLKSRLTGFRALSNSFMIAKRYEHSWVKIQQNIGKIVIIVFLFHILTSFIKQFVKILHFCHY